MIPRVIHQTWKSQCIPSEWKRAAESWKLYHPNWEFRLWTDDDNLRLVSKEFPDLRDFFESLPYKILQADVARVLILYKVRWCLR